MVSFFLMRSMSIGASSAAKRLCLCVLVRILLPIIHLFLKRLCLLFIREGESSEAAFQLKGVEKDAILVVLKGVIYLLIPNYATIGRLGIVSTPFQTESHLRTDISTSLIHKV
jgi:hypothetical protein